MISLIESSFLRPPNASVPSNEDLNQYSLSRQQYDDWKKNNPDGKWRKFENAFMDPRLQALMAAYTAMNGRYISAVNHFNRSLPEEVEKRNQYHMHQDLSKAREYYGQKNS